jgi:hypothetical protein
MASVILSPDALSERITTDAVKKRLDAETKRPDTMKPRLDAAKRLDSKSWRQSR